MQSIPMPGLNFLERMLQHMDKYGIAAAKAQTAFFKSDLRWVVISPVSFLYSLWKNGKSLSTIFKKVTLSCLSWLHFYLFQVLVCTKAVTPLNFRRLKLCLCSRRRDRNLEDVTEDVHNLTSVTINHTIQIAMKFAKISIMFLLNIQPFFCIVACNSIFVVPFTRLNKHLLRAWKS